MAKKFTLGAGLELSGEKEFRKAISDINSDMRVLGSEMKLMSTRFDGNANSLDALTKKDKALNEQLDKQKQKVDIVRKALENAKSEYGENDTRVDKWKTSLNNAENQVEKLNQDIKKNKQYMDEAKRSTNKTASSIDEFGKQTNDAKTKVGLFGVMLKSNLTSQAIIGGVKLLASEMKSVGKELVNIAAGAAAYADDISTMAKVTGLSTDSLQEFTYMTDLVDVSVDTITGSLRKNIASMQKAAEGNKSYAKYYKELGVSVEDANGNLRDSEEVYWACIDSLGEMKNETKRDAIAMKLFGKSAQDLNPMILEGSDGMKKLKQEAHSMGAIMSKDALSSLNNTQDASDRMTQSMNVLKREIGLKLAPVVTNLSEKFLAFVSDNKEKISEFCGGALNVLVSSLRLVKDNLDTIAVGAATFISMFAISKISTFISGAVTGFIAIKKAVDSAKASQVLLNIAQNGMPIAIITALLVAGGYALYKYASSADKLKTGLGKLTDEQIAFHEEVDKSYDSYIDQKKAMDDSVQSVKNQFAPLEDLSEKLDDVVTANGKVKKGHEDEAKYITGELSDALGIEVKILKNNTIPAYKKTKEKIDDLIESRKAEVMLSTYQDQWVKATNEKKQAAIDYAKANNDVIDTKNKLSAAEDKAAKMKESLDKKTKGLSGRSLLAYKGEFDALNDQYELINNLKSSLKENETTLDKAEKKYVGIKTTLTNYNKLQKAIAGGDQQKLKQALDNITSGFISAKNGTKKTLEEQIQVTEKAYTDIKTALKNGAEGITQEDVDQIDKMRKKAKTALDKWKKANTDAIEDTHDQCKKTFDYEGDTKNTDSTAYAAKTASENICTAFTTGLKLPKLSGTKKDFENLLGAWNEINFGNASSSNNATTNKSSVSSKLISESSQISAKSKSSARDVTTSLGITSQSKQPFEVVNQNNGGDLVVQLVTPSGEKVFETVVKEFRKAKKRDNSVSLA